MLPCLASRGIVSVSHGAAKENAVEHLQNGPDDTDLEAVNSGLGELLGDGDLSPSEVDVVGTPHYWLNEQDIAEARRLLGENRL